ncbi:c-type cytochrome [Kaarinaea lacus]
MSLTAKVLYSGFLSLFIVFLCYGAPLMADEGVANSVKVPFKFAVGKKKFQENCASCHGQRLEGSKVGPPLLHGFYKPSHHNDASFYRAALNGVRAHHWNFGNMPRIEGVTRKDMDQIIPFIRWYQQEKGLY